MPSDSPSRNSPCPCGSGKRFKHCCGDLAADAAQTARPTLSGLMTSALDRQRSGDLEGAETSYRDALKLAPENPDCLHMLGVICHQTGRQHEALKLIFEALEATDWKMDAMRHNIGLVIAEILTSQHASQNDDLAGKYEDFLVSARPLPTPEQPLVSIVIPSFNHAQYIRQAILSVFNQTYRPLELIVIDDGSTDDSCELIEQALADAPIPARLVRQTNQGAHAALNLGCRLAAGDYINPLNSDDCFEPDRVERMVEDIAWRGGAWGFGTIRHIDEHDRPFANNGDLRESAYLGQLLRLGAYPSLGVALHAFNLAISTGNLFFSKRLFEATGGFRPLRYNHDWDFCIRASWIAEPRLSPHCTYLYRLHGRNTISEGRASTTSEANSIFGEYIATTSEPEFAPENPFALAFRNWAMDYFRFIWQAGQGALIPVATLSKLVHTLTDTGLLTEAEATPAGMTSANGLHELARRAFLSIAPPPDSRPLLSILLPTYNTPARWLHRCIESVSLQLHENWELCIADDASTEPHVLAIIREWAKRDERIRFRVRDSNGHISASTNTALEMARGDFVVLLDHDDELPCDALFWVAHALSRQPDAGMVFSNEDKIDELGQVSRTYHKVGLNRELLRAQNCISHLGAYRRSLIVEIGGFREGFEGAQDWDLALRVAERLGDAQIVHVPRTLYHWRSISGSTARGSSQKSYIVEAQRKALTEHHERAGRSARLLRLGDFWHTLYTEPDQTAAVTFVVDARGRPARIVPSFILSLSRGAGPRPVNFIVFDDSGAAFNMTDLAVTCCNALPGTPTGALWCGIPPDALGKYVVLCRPDWQPVEAHWLERWTGRAGIENTGFVAPRIVSGDGRIIYAGTVLTPSGEIRHPFAGRPSNYSGQACRAMLAQNYQAHCNTPLMIQSRHFVRLRGELACELGNAGASIAACLAARDLGLENPWYPPVTLTQTLDKPVEFPAAAEIDALRARWNHAFTHDPAHSPLTTGN